MPLRHIISVTCPSSENSFDFFSYSSLPSVNIQYSRWHDLVLALASTLLNRSNDRRGQRSSVARNLAAACSPSEIDLNNSLAGRAHRRFPLYLSPLCLFFISSLPFAPYGARTLRCTTLALMPANSWVSTVLCSHLHDCWRGALLMPSRDVLISGAGLTCRVYVCFLSFVYSMWGSDKQNGEMAHCISGLAANLR